MPNKDQMFHIDKYGCDSWKSTILRQIRAFANAKTPEEAALKLHDLKRYLSQASQWFTEEYEIKVKQGE